MAPGPRAQGPLPTASPLRSPTSPGPQRRGPRPVRHKGHSGLPLEVGGCEMGIDFWGQRSQVLGRGPHNSERQAACLRVISRGPNIAKLFVSQSTLATHCTRLQNCRWGTGQEKRPSVPAIYGGTTCESYLCGSPESEPHTTGHCFKYGVRFHSLWKWPLIGQGGSDPSEASLASPM